MYTHTPSHSQRLLDPCWRTQQHPKSAGFVAWAAAGTANRASFKLKTPFPFPLRTDSAPPRPADRLRKSRCFEQIFRLLATLLEPWEDKRTATQRHQPSAVRLPAGLEDPHFISARNYPKTQYGCTTMITTIAATSMLWWIASCGRHHLNLDTSSPRPQRARRAPAVRDVTKAEGPSRVSLKCFVGFGFRV